MIPRAVPYMQKNNGLDPNPTSPSMGRGSPPEGEYLRNDPPQGSMPMLVFAVRSS
jgi:hypothetical protein